MDGREHLWSGYMRAANRGDTVAYERLLGDIARTMRPVASRRLARLGVGIAEAEDVVQEVLVAIHGKRHTWDEARPIVPWIAAITRYKVADAARRLLRQRRRHVDTPVEDWADWLTWEAPDVDGIPTAGLDRLIGSLPARERGAVRAVALNGDTIRNAADRLATSEGAVRVALHRGLRRLAVMIGRDPAPKRTR